MARGHFGNGDIVTTEFEPGDDGFEHATVAVIYGGGFAQEKCSVQARVGTGDKAEFVSSTLNTHGTGIADSREHARQVAYGMAERHLEFRLKEFSVNAQLRRAEHAAKFNGSSPDCEMAQERR